MSLPNNKSIRRLFALAIVLLLISNPSQVEGEPTNLRAQEAVEEVPSAMFSWAQTPKDLGSVVMPAASTGGWFGGTSYLRYRRIPSFTSDVTLEIIVDAPYSGHDRLAERFMIQFPIDWASRPFKRKAVVVGFHSFSVSEKQIFLHTDLPFECQRRGWMLIAPYGLKDENFANVASQESLKTILFMLHRLIGFNHHRIYGVGFSMGGLNAVSYAMRYQSPGDPRFAAVVNHTGTVDMLREYNAADAFRQFRLRNRNHFGASPTDDPFAYKRVSPVLFQRTGQIDEEHTPISNALHIPFYFHANLADPNVGLLAGTLALKNYLSFHGATVHENLVVDPVAGHSWSTLPMAQALDSVAGHTLLGAPPNLVVEADRITRWQYTDVCAKPAKAHAKFELEISPFRLSRLNSFAVTKTENLDELRIRLRAMGLDPTAELLFTCSSADGTDDILLLKGYRNPPQAVRIAQVASSSWTHDAAAREIRIQLSYGTRPAKVLIQP